MDHCICEIEKAQHRDKMGGNWREEGFCMRGRILYNSSPMGRLIGVDKYQGMLCTNPDRHNCFSKSDE